MSKPEKYLVFSRQEVIAMYNSLNEQEIISGCGSVILRCEHADSKYPGQLRLTDECRQSFYPYWPNELLEQLEVI